MQDLSRRALLGGAAAMALGAGASAQAMRHDLLIRGGEVLDPSQGLRGRRDVAIRNGLVSAVEPEIPAERAAQVIDAGGKLVCPGSSTCTRTSTPRSRRSACRRTSWCPGPRPPPT
jgi:dihydroorotase